MLCSENITRRLFEARKAQIIKEGYEEMDRDELISKAQSGDQYAFEKLLKDHKGFLYKMTAQYIMDTQDKDDIMQLANIAFWDAVRKWNGSGDFEAFAGMVINRRMTDALRKDSTGKVEINTSADHLDRTAHREQNGGQELKLYDITPDKSNPSSEEAYIKSEDSKKLADFMKTNMTKLEREVMELYSQEYKMKQIAAKLDLPYKKAENALMRAKHKLRDFIMSSGIRESRQLRETNEFSRREKRILGSILKKIIEEEMVVDD